MTKIKEFFSSRNNLEYLIGGVIFIVLSVVLIWSASMRDSDTTISIDNPQMYDAVMESLNDPVITLDEAAQVKELVIKEHKGLDDLSDLEEFTGLEILTINSCTMDSLEGIQNFKHLQKIIVVSTTLDATPLTDAGLSELRNVQLTGVHLDDTQRFIDNYPDLEVMYLRETGASGKITVKDMPNLTKLELRNDDVTEVELENLPLLFEVNYDRLQITDIEGTLDIPTIEKLVLTFTPLTNIDGISRLENLKEIRLQGTEVTDLSELAEIEGFNSIYLDKWFDRSKIEFLRDHFREGDIYTKMYFLGDLA